MNVREERIRRGLTRPQMAEAVGIPYKTLQRAEHGNPIREDNAKLLADFLGCEPIEFVEPDRSAAA